MRYQIMSVGLLLAASAGVAHADVITDWNTIVLNAVKNTATPPPKASRIMAMVHVAQYEAVNSVTKSHNAFDSYLDCPTGTSAEAAAAQAARDVMASLFPTLQADFDIALSSQLGSIAPGASRTNGILLGQASASRVLTSRVADGSSTITPYTPGSGIGDWVPTPPANAPALLPNWKNVTPFTMSSGSQFRPPAPPEPGDAQYAVEYDEVKSLGAKTESTRTAEQTDIARMWAAGAGTVTPPGMWNQIAQQISAEQSLTLDENARLFAMLGTGLADAAIVAWDAKYEYNTWRPITAIRQGDFDGNPLTVGDAAWESLLTTPNFPAYTSGHSTFSSAAATILAQFFGTDSIEFTASSDGITRSFNSLWSAAEEAGMSRIYGGIHFQADNIAGLTSGRELGLYLASTHFTMPTPGAAVALTLAGLGLARRRR